MRTARIQATAVARLYGEDPTEIVGWLYVWNTEELGIRCRYSNLAFRFIDPPVDLNQYSRRFRANKRVRARLASIGPLPSPSL